MELVKRYKKTDKKIIQVQKIETCLENIIQVIGVVKQYLTDRAEGKSHVLFSNIKEPSFSSIGAVVELDTGHTKEYNTQEEACLNAHLMAAGFGDVETSNFIQDMAIDDSRLNIRDS